MKVGTVTEIKTHEYRVGLTPDCVRSYTARGHKVFVQSSAGLAAGFEDEEYRAAGATIAPNRETVFGECEMIVKVKDPMPEECAFLQRGQILFTSLHLAASRDITMALLERGVSGVAYETIETDDGSLPCLRPMSEIAGRMATQEGAKYLEKPFGGRGVLLGGVPGVPRGKVGILGGGVVGLNACKIAVGMGADVTVLDINPLRLSYLDDLFSASITTLYNTDANLEALLAQSDVVIGAVLVTGTKAPRLVRRRHLGLMKKGSVIVDVAVDQGGCVETIRPTTHDNPVYILDGIVHYGVANIPGAVTLTSTRALTSVTLGYGLLLAEHGVEGACRISRPLARGVNTYQGYCVYPGVAAAFGLDHKPIAALIK